MSENPESGKITTTKEGTAMNRDRYLRTGLAALIVVLLGSVSFDALAQRTEPWVPKASVTLVLPYGTASGPNATSRHIAEKLSQLWKQSVIVENMPGSGGVLGTRRVINAKPDGRTFLVQLTSMVLTKHIPGLAGDDPIPHLLPVAGFATSPLVIAAGNHVQGASLTQVIQGCRTTTSPCSMGTVGHLAKIAAEQFKADSGLKDLIVVNYKESTQVVTDMAGGRLSFTILGGSVLAQMKQGMIKGIVLTAPKRLADVPDLPTTAEAGWPNYQFFYWYALFAPKGTPPEIVQSLASAVRDLAKAPELIKTAQTYGAEVIVAGPEELARHVETETARYDRLVKLYPIAE